MSLKVRRLSGEDLKAAMSDLAALRIEVFRDFPYLYEGSLEYEKKYLQIYLKSERCVVIAAYEGEKIIGAATALPLSDEADYVKAPFIKAGFNLEQVFYFGESVLKKSYRGQGLGHAFFDEREKAALAYPQYAWTCFCAVQRPEDHPLRPEGYKPLDEFWMKRGYAKNENLKAEFVWQDLDEKSESAKPMTYWLKEWKR